MSPGDIECVDLLATAKDLQADFPKIAHLIWRLRDAHSAHTDLATALDMVEASPEASNVAGRPVWAQHAAMAMMQMAIILYVRATKTRSDHRGVLNLRDRFTPDQLAFHAHLSALRDDALAHFGPGEIEPGRDFHREHLILPLDRPDDMRIAMLSHRLTFDPPFVHRLHTHLLRVIILVQRETQAREAIVVDSINELALDPVFQKIVTRHRRKASDALGDAETASRMLAGVRSGLRTEMQWDGWVRAYPASQ